MNAADVIVVIWVALTALSGWRRGLTAQALSLGGLVLGAYAGSKLAPLVLADRVQSPWSPLVSLGGALLGALVLQLAAGPIGTTVRIAILRGPLRAADSITGVLLGAAFGLAAAWLVAIVALHQPAIGLRSHVQGSAILSGLVHRFPPDNVLSALGTLDPLPLLSGFPDRRLPEPDPNLEPTQEMRRSARSVVRVLGTACGLGVQGSGWVAGRGLVMTNAHVVAGTDETVIQLPGGRVLGARLVLIQPRTDVALLRVRNLETRPLELATSDPDREAVALAGYPRNGSLTLETATAGRPVGVLAPDGLGQDIGLRQVVPLRGEVEPGDSGGPVLDGDGRVVAMMFGATREGNGGVGVPLAAISEALSAELRPTDSGPCAR